MNNKLFELIEELSDKIDRGMKDCFELNDFILFKNDIDWELLKIIIKEENEEGFSSKWDKLEVQYSIVQYNMNNKLEELIVKEYIKIVKELKDWNESSIEGIINLSKENMMTNVWEVIDSVDVKEVQYNFIIYNS